MKALMVPNFSKYNARGIFGSVSRSFALHGVQMIFCKPLPQDVALPQGALELPLEGALQECNVIVCIGGDGTILDGASYSARSGRPLMGINAGRLGFLAQVEPDIMDHYLDRLAEDDYQLQPRSGLSASFSDGCSEAVDFALNDIVLSKLDVENIVDFEVSCDGRIMDRYLADGIIFSSPTGSTAYSLSAGGPVIDPLLSTISVVPICPHAVTTRPIVFSTRRRLSIRSESSTISVVADGRRRVSIPQGCVIRIGESAQHALFIDFGDFEFFEILKTKIKQRG